MSQLGGQVKGLGGDIAGLVYALEPLTPIILDIVSVFRILLQSINKIIGFSNIYFKRIIVRKFSYCGVSLVFMEINFVFLKYINIKARVKGKKTSV